MVFRDFIFTVSGILLSQSTVAIGTAIIITPLALLFLSKPKLATKVKVLTLLSVFFLGFAFLLLTLSQEKASVSSRLMFWQAGLRLAADKPIFGIGLDNLRYVASQYITPQNVLLGGGQTAMKITDMHNLLLDLASQTGLMEAVLFVLFVFGLLLKGGFSPSEHRAFVLGLAFAALSFFLVMQATPPSLETLSYFWLTSGFTASFLQSKKFSITNQVLLTLAFLLSFALLFLTSIYAWKVWQADSYFNLALQSSNVNETVFLTQKATESMPYDHYYGTVASLAIQLSETGNTQFLQLVKLAASKAIATNNLEGNNYAALGYYYMLLNNKNSFKKAVFYFKEALKRDPYNLNATYGLSKSYFLFGSKKQGNKWLSKLTNYISPQDERLLELKKMAN